MTRDEFDVIYLEEYKNLCGYATRKIGADGIDVVHTTYQHVVEHATHENGPIKHAKRWLYFKLCRELVRYRKTIANRQEAELEGHKLLVEEILDR